MNTLLWTLSIGLAAIYAVAGAGKLIAPRERLLALGMGWVEETPIPLVRIIGALEIAGAIGVIVPWASGILPFLTPIAAWGLAGVQVGAIATNIRHGERNHVGLNVLLLVAAVVVAIGRSLG